MIELKGVTKTYTLGGEKIYALRDVNLTIQPGAFLAITGPSGSGKSTLANVIGGLDMPDAGQVIVDEKPLSQANDTALSAFRNQKVGFVFQTFNLQPNYTALENVLVPLLLGKMKGRERLERATECLKAVGLGDRLRHRPDQLSGGQRQRVAIARALANKPAIIIADEPTGNLDSERGKEIIALLKNLNHQAKITLIVITHDSDIAKQADHIVNIRDGRVS